MPGLPGMPHMIEKLIRMPYFLFACIDQSKCHLIRTADVSKIVNMFIGSTNIYQILTKS